MRAHVYRFIEDESRVLGLVWPSEFLIIVSTLLLSSKLLGSYLLSLVVGAVAYWLLRRLTRDKAPNFPMHFVQWKGRQNKSGGRLSAAARAPAAPRFPFHPYRCQSRDVLSPRQRALLAKVLHHD